MDIVSCTDASETRGLGFEYSPDSTEQLLSVNFKKDQSKSNFKKLSKYPLIWSHWK